ncbi:AraC family ligand binding domain-containing protein, partial [Klebsiella pneumoniae]
MIEVSRFWRDPALPFVEARKVGDGRQVCYAAHSHESFSIGVITGGRSTYLNGDQRHEVAAGTTVL